MKDSLAHLRETHKNSSLSPELRISHNAIKTQMYQKFAIENVKNYVGENESLLDSLLQLEKNARRNKIKFSNYTLQSYLQKPTNSAEYNFMVLYKETLNIKNFITLYMQNRTTNTNDQKKNMRIKEIIRAIHFNDPRSTSGSTN